MCFQFSTKGCQRWGRLNVAGKTVPKSRSSSDEWAVADSDWRTSKWPEVNKRNQPLARMSAMYCSVSERYCSTVQTSLNLHCLHASHAVKASIVFGDICPSVCMCVSPSPVHILHGGAQPWLEAATCELQIRCFTNSATTSPVHHSDTLTQLRSGERTGHQLLWSTTLLLIIIIVVTDPAIWQLGFNLPPHTWSYAQPFPGRPKPKSCKYAQMWSCPITFPWLWPVTDHEPHSRHVPTNRIWSYSTKQMMM